MSDTPHHTTARFVGGPASGQIVTVPAVWDTQRSVWMPRDMTFRWVQQPRMRLALTTSLQPQAAMSPSEEWFYLLQPLRNGRWVYVLDGLADNSELLDLEEMVSRLRASWSGVVQHTFHEEATEIVRQHAPLEYEETLRRKLFRELYETAEDNSLMIVEVRGPSWERPPGFALPRYVLQAWCTKRPVT